MSTDEEMLEMRAVILDQCDGKDSVNLLDIADFIAI
jgi:hypothetical protein